MVVTAGVYREPRLEVTVPVTILGEGEAVLDGGGRARGADAPGGRHHGARPHDPERRRRATPRIGRASGSTACAAASSPTTGCSDTFFGIYAARSSDCLSRATGSRGTARRQTAAGNAIHLFSSEGFTVAGNRIRGHRDGIYLEFSRRATILGNDSRGNLRYGLHFMYSDSCEYRRNVFAGERRRGGGDVQPAA